MKIEHFAINVEDPRAMADWYCVNLSMSVSRKLDKAPFTHFLADSSGSVMIEIYNNPVDQVPDYRNMDPLLLHLAFVSRDPQLDSKPLINAGATFQDEVCLKDGSHLMMLRDPWGLAIQLCKRAEPMLAAQG
ncbi:MAG: VOC family protein [Spongiibacteraceae bacterium]|nr:VOC family protein [Spongiibacteraceae bacterium]